MDRVLRNYAAQTAWTPADPLAGLDPNVRRAILLMPSTFRERWKLAPWTSQQQRRLAIQHIVAERRLMYDLTHQEVNDRNPDSGPSPAVPASAEITSPYYQHRLALHRQTVDTMARVRTSQDRHDFETLAEAQADLERRRARRQALLDIEFERERLDLLELEILDGGVPQRIAEPPQHARTFAPTKKKMRDRTR